MKTRGSIANRLLTAKRARVEKPIYTIPTMREIAKIEGSNGLRLASTFSGCGGSCLGFEMAGFRTVFASEFIAAARETYLANHPGVPLDARDIREVEGSDILGAAECQRGELDVLEGSPPCASFSVCGKREAGWGKVRKYSDSEQRVDDLFFEFIRLVDETEPKVFVAENVAGLAKGSAIGYFKTILSEMKLAGRGYNVEARLLDAQALGVPQTRSRLIFVGVRSDLKIAPVFPAPLPYRYLLREAIDLESRSSTDAEERDPVNESASIERFAIGKEWENLKPGEQSEKYLNLVRCNPDAPCPTICASHGCSSLAGITHPYRCRKFYISELKRLASFPADFVLSGSYEQQWERIGRAVPPLMMRAIAVAIRDGIFGTLAKKGARLCPRTK